MKDEIKQNLIILLKLFKDKPQFLINFMLKHNAFDGDFLKKVFESDELNRMRTLKDNENTSDEDIFSQLPHFKSIANMNQYFRELINKTEEEEEDHIYQKVNDELEKNLKKQLREALENEEYEIAASIRDRMKELNIKF